MPRLPLLMGFFSASWTLLDAWGSRILRQEMLMERGTKVPEGDLWL